MSQCWTSSSAGGKPYSAVVADHSSFTSSASLLIDFVCQNVSTDTLRPEDAVQDEQKTMRSIRSVIDAIERVETVHFHAEATDLLDKAIDRKADHDLSDSQLREWANGLISDVRDAGD